jgi:hypothetical protein
MFSWASWEPCPGRKIQVTFIPHPSGRSRTWNDPMIVAESRALFADLLKLHEAPRTLCPICRSGVGAAPPHGGDGGTHPGSAHLPGDPAPTPFSLKIDEQEASTR